MPLRSDFNTALATFLTYNEILLRKNLLHGVYKFLIEFHRIRKSLNISERAITMKMKKEYPKKLNYFILQYTTVNIHLANYQFVANTIKGDLMKEIVNLKTRYLKKKSK